MKRSAWISLIACFACHSTATAQQLLTNGNFQANGAAGITPPNGWTVVSQSGSGGSWYTQTGSLSPLNNLQVLPSPDETFTAATDSHGPGSNALLQTFTVPSAGTVVLTFNYAIVNLGPDFIDPNPDTLDFAAGANQQVRVDILAAAAGPFDVGTSSVLLNVLQPQSGTTLMSTAYVPVSMDISSVVGAGGTYQLRFAEVDTQGYLLFGVDNVSVSFTAASLTPQTITFAPLSDQTLGSSPPPLSATASSGLGVMFASNTGAVCSLSGANITLSAVGICSITASQNGNSSYAEATPVTQTFTVSAAGIQPAAGFLDPNGAPALTFNGSTSFPDAGGFLIGAPGVTQDLSGNVYVVGLDGAGGVHLNSYSFANSTWNGWQYSGGILDVTSGLTAAVAPNGIVWFTGRDIGNRYWINSWNGTSFGGWILVADGIFAGNSIPQIAVTGDGTVWIIGADIGGRIWSNSYNPISRIFTGWVDRQGVIYGQPSVTAGQDGLVYVAVRNVAAESPVYITQIPAQNAATATTFLNGGGQIDADPQITSQDGTVYLMAVADGGTVYLLTFSEATQAFGAWNFANGILNSATIAAAAGNVFVAGLDSGDRIYWYSVTGNNWFFAGGAGVSSTSLGGAK